MLGILIEIVIGFAVATKDEIEEIHIAHQYDLSSNALAEANARLSSVSNATAMNSPVNFPISSVSGNAEILVSKKDSPIIMGLKNKRAALWLTAGTEKISGIPVYGRVLGVGTNQFGEAELSILFSGSNLEKVGPSPRVSFNSLNGVRVKLIPDDSSSETFHFELERGYLNLWLNAGFEYSADFEFSHQTNGFLGVFGTRKPDPFEMFPVPQNR